MPNFTAQHIIPLLPESAADPPYVLTLTSSPAHIAATTSSQTLHLLDPHTFRQTHLFQTGQTLAALAAHPDHPSIFATTGNGEKNVKIWDARAQEGCIATWGAEKPLLSLALSSSLLATGSELASSQANISIHDIRQLASSPASSSTPLLSLSESHNDDIVHLSFTDPKTRTLLSAATDGLLNIYDLDAPGLDFSDPEDTALLRTLNLGSAVHTAGWLGAEGAVWGTSSDEKMGVWEGDEDGAEWLPGDVRGPLGCQYIAGVFGSGHTPKEQWVVSGDVAREDGVGVLTARRLRKKKGEWGFGKEVAVFDGAHGQEVVRGVLWETYAEGIVITAGEDGMVKVWKEEAGAVGKAKKEKEKGRFKPY